MQFILNGFLQPKQMISLEGDWSNLDAMFVTFIAIHNCGHNFELHNFCFAKMFTSQDSNCYYYSYLRVRIKWVIVENYGEMQFKVKFFQTESKVK